MRIIRDKGIIESASAPSSTDIYRIGTIWVDKTENESYILVDVTAGVATWGHTLDSISGVMDAEGDYLSNEQTTVNMMSKGTVYRFDNADDVVIAPDTAANLDIFANGGTLSAWIYPKSDGETDNGRIIDKSTGGSNGYVFNVDTESGGFVSIRFLRLGDGTDGNWETGSVIPLNTWSHVAVTYSDAAQGTAPVFYHNGVALSLVVSTAATGNLGSDTGITLKIGGNGSGGSTFDGSMAHAQLDNFARTAAEVKDLISGNIPFKWQYGSQTEFLTGDDVNWGTDAAGKVAFDTAYDWTVNGNPTSIAVATNVMSITSSTSGEGIYLDGLTAGKEYKMNLNVSSITGTWDIQSPNAVSIGTITATGLYELEFIAGDTFIRIFATGIADQLSIDASAISNSIIPIGVVALYDQTSISETYWGDIANNNDGAVTGATVLNQPDGMAFKNIILSPVGQDATPKEGELIYNSATNKLNFWNGSAWEVVTSA